MIKTIRPTNSLRGTITLPGDKSISHRSAIFNSIAKGHATISNFSLGEDCSSTIDCLKQLGVKIHREKTSSSIIEIEGSNSTFLKPTQILNAGNSGTTLRLLSGILAAQQFETIISGDHSLNRRPMGRIIKPLNLMGANVQSQSGNERPPISFHSSNLKGIEYKMPIASAQVKSCLMIASLFANKKTIITELSPTRDHTERMMLNMGANIAIKDQTIEINPGKLTSLSMTVPGDMSAAAFWLVAATIHKDAKIIIREVGMNPSRTAIVTLLQNMGAKISINNMREVGGEPIADLTVESSEIKGIEIKGEMIPSLIDELPIIAVAACFAKGKTIIEDAQELRAKESDRISAIVQELKRLNAKIRETPNGMVIEGNNSLAGASCESHGDHRIAMAIAIAAINAKGVTNISDAECVSISYPEFWETLLTIEH
jgi:3-phosphoshikimate 1-carboxyvinyltransferase